MWITSSAKLQIGTNKMKLKGEWKSAIPEDDLLTLQMLHGERQRAREGLKIFLSPILQAVGINIGNFDSFRTIASLLPPTNRFQKPLKNPVHFHLLFEALLLHRPLSSHLHPFLTPYRLPLAYPHGSHTGQWVPKLWYQYHSLCVGHSKADPSHWISFLWNT